MKANSIQRNQLVISRLLPMKVQNIRTYKSGFTYAVCPRCDLSMEREYVRYCSNCGQKLDWQSYVDCGENETENKGFIG